MLKFLVATSPELHSEAFMGVALGKFGEFFDGNLFTVAFGTVFFINYLL